ncbi:MAG: hypothetical protein EXR69_05505 [Myxococcales bacterium]|nr:hypothetical protein [Myxococcales bacterium]
MSVESATFAVFAVGALAIGRFAHRPLLGRFGGGTLQHLVRLPGNLLHELAHAVVMLLTGYTISGFTVSLFDASGRGHVVPGPAWTRLARPWITNLLSPIAPAIVGLAALAALHLYSGMPALPTSLAGVLPVLAAVPWATWQLWVALALGFSVAAEMAPSDIDLGVWWRPALGAALLVAAGSFAAEQLRPGTLATLAATTSATLGGLGLPETLRAWSGRSLSLTVASGLAVGPVAWAASRVRAG